MTIRQYIGRRVTTVTLLALAPFVAIQVFVQFTHPSLELAYAALTYFLVGVPWLIVNVRRIRCPKCQSPLGGAAMQVGMNLSKPRSCPNCGVSLDEPMP